MSELTHINCVALTARFPVGKPVVPAMVVVIVGATIGIKLFKKFTSKAS